MYTTDACKGILNDDLSLLQVNDRMNEALKIANSKSTQFCVYIICVVVLLGVLGVLFSLVT